MYTVEVVGACLGGWLAGWEVGEPSEDFVRGWDDGWLEGFEGVE